MNTTIAPDDSTTLHRPTAVLTERGHAALAFYRFLDVVRELAPDDRAAVLDLFAAETAAELAERRI